MKYKYIRKRLEQLEKEKLEFQRREAYQINRIDELTVENMKLRSKIEINEIKAKELNIEFEDKFALLDRANR